MNDKNFLDILNKNLPELAVVIMCGLPATGKTTVAKKIAKAKRYELLSSDMLRIKLLKGEDVFDKNVASNMDKRLMVYEKLFEEAFKIIKQGRGVILDATFVKRHLRERAAHIAYLLKKPFVIIETVCSQKVAIDRIRKRRSKKEYESNAITEEAYFNNLKIFEPIDLKGLANKYPDISLYYFLINTEDWIVQEMKLV